MAAVSSAPTALTLDALPVDVLLDVLRLFPVVPRIRTLSCLSKRWHELAYRSVDALTEKSIYSDWSMPPGFSDVLARLPSLTRLSIVPDDSRAEVITLPTRLQHLGTRSPIKLQEPLSVQLSSMSLMAYGIEDQKSVEALLTASASSLRTLSLHTTTPQPLEDVLKTIHLPRLTELVIDCMEGFDAMLAFYKRHASQLEKLTLVAQHAPIAEGIAEHELPLLRTLTWHATNHPSMPQLSTVQQVLSRCPRLTALHTTFVPDFDVTLTSLRSLRLQGPHQLDPPRLRRLFPQLSAISIESASVETLSALGTLADLVTACHFTAGPDTARECLARLSRVDSLTIELQCQPDDFLPLPALRHLRVLRLGGSEAWEDFMGTALHFVRATGTLDSIVIYNASDEPDEDDWAEFVRELDVRAVRLLSLVDCGGVPREPRPAWLSIRAISSDLDDEELIPEH